MIVELSSNNNRYKIRDKMTIKNDAKWKNYNNKDKMKLIEGFIKSNSKIKVENRSICNT